MRRKFTWAAAISILALGAGCAAPQGGAPAAGAAVPNPSGFLQDYSRLRPVPGREGRYVHITETIRGFRAILDGEVDSVPERAFYMQGTLDDVLNAGKG